MDRETRYRVRSRPSVSRSRNGLLFSRLLSGLLGWGCAIRSCSGLLFNRKRLGRIDRNLLGRGRRHRSFRGRIDGSLGDRGGLNRNLGRRFDRDFRGGFSGRFRGRGRIDGSLGDRSGLNRNLGRRFDRDFRGGFSGRFRGRGRIDGSLGDRGGLNRNLGRRFDRDFRGGFSGRFRGRGRIDGGLGGRFLGLPRLLRILGQVVGQLIDRVNEPLEHVDSSDRDADVARISSGALLGSFLCDGHRTAQPCDDLSIASHLLGIHDPRQLFQCSLQLGPQAQQERQLVRATHESTSPVRGKRKDNPDNSGLASIFGRSA
jgi:hypothetical protein